jgi:hypothetical protein
LAGLYSVLGPQAPKAYPEYPLHPLAFFPE